MTLHTIEKKLKSVRPSLSHENSYFMALVQDFPPLPINNREAHVYFSKILEMISREIVNLEQRDDSSAKAHKFLDALSLYASIIAKFIEDYEKRMFPSRSTGRAVLRFLMDQHDIAQTDLGKELGGQSVVSDILAGRRFLNANQIQLLANRFRISPASFFPVK